MHRSRKPATARRRVPRPGGTLFASLLATLALATGPVAAETKIDVETLFRVSGCNEYKVQRVAVMEETGERIYVAWCAALTNYLAIVDCKAGVCKRLEKPEAHPRPRSTADPCLQLPPMPGRRMR